MVYRTTGFSDIHSVLLERRCRFFFSKIAVFTELFMGWVDPWVGLGRDFSVFGGLGWVGPLYKSTKNLKGLR